MAAGSLPSFGERPSLSHEVLKEKFNKPFLPVAAAFFTISSPKR